tara:strand:- start:7699 stop:7866 length:168 start_codon:yes stop_codon:yes gene_type:complete
MAKNAFEIRTDILELATKIVLAGSNESEKCEVEEVLKVANELNKFVSEKSDSSSR